MLAVTGARTVDCCLVANDAFILIVVTFLFFFYGDTIASVVRNELSWNELSLNDRFKRFVKTRDNIRFSLNCSRVECLV